MHQAKLYKVHMNFFLFVCYIFYFLQFQELTHNWCEKKHRKGFFTYFTYFQLLSLQASVWEHKMVQCLWPLTMGSEGQAALNFFFTPQREACDTQLERRPDGPMRGSGGTAPNLDSHYCLWTSGSERHSEAISSNSSPLPTAARYQFGIDQWIYCLHGCICRSSSPLCTWEDALISRHWQQKWTKTKNKVTRGFKLSWSKKY